MMSWTAGVLAGYHGRCMASPFDKLRVTPLPTQRYCVNSVFLSLPKETRAKKRAGEDAGGPRA
jgi:hypothetical protein